MKVRLQSAAAFLCLAVSLSGATGPVVSRQAELLPAPRSTAAGPLLFAYVTSQSGYDTEINVANTSRDTVGSTPQSGSCTLSFYGSGTVPGPQTTPSIAAGQHLVFALSTGGGGIAAAPDFTGYLIANCAFPLARGTARVLSEGHLAFSQDAQAVTLPRSAATPQRLLFPFVSSQSGFDTSLVLANTSQDPFGTVAAAGTCTLSFYGDGAPAPWTTPLIAAGSVFSSQASAVAPNFQGYAMAACDFLAAGSGFVGNRSHRNLDFAETPEVVTLPRSPAPEPLLFPALTSQNGRDAVIAIANTSADPFDTAPGSGACTLNFSGANAPAPLVTPTIRAGEVYSNLLSAIAPNFQGYMRASCSFPLARPAAYAGAAADAARTVGSAPAARLLFAAVSNRAGADTTIVISNPSGGSAGSRRAGFACTIDYYGEMAGGSAVPAPQVSSTIAPGGQLWFSLSQGSASQGIAGAPGFRGYVIADCGAQARGASVIAETTATPSIGSVLGAFADLLPLAPGSIASIYGGSLGSSTSVPTVTVGNLQAYVYSGNIASQINIEIPVNAPLGQNNVVVTVNGVASAPFAITLTQYAPEVDAANFGTGIAVCTRANSSVVSASNAPNPLETLSCYGEGFGPTTPSVATGAMAPSSPFAQTTTQPTVTIGVSRANVAFSGLAPGEIALYQFNFQVPGPVSAGTQNMSVAIGGDTANLVTLPVAALTTTGLYVTGSQNGTFTEGQSNATYTLTVSNAVAAIASSGTVTITDALPAGLTFVSMAGSGWQCTAATCTRSDSLAASASYPPITLTVNIAANAAAQVTNDVAVSGGGSNAYSVGIATTITPVGNPPSPVITFTPSQGATGVSTTASVTWGAASGATSYTVYFGTTNSPPQAMSGITGTSYTPPAMAANTTYYWSVTAVNAFGSTPSALWYFTTGASTGYRFVPVTPCRVMDTRTGQGFSGAFGPPTIAGGAVRVVPIPTSSCGIPSTAQAYSLNVTVVPPGPLTYLTIWPTGVTQPVVSTLNSFDGRIVANAAIVPAGTSGEISVYVSNTSDVIIDINGYFAPASTSGAESFYPVTPCRVVDTRGATGQFGGPFMSANTTRTFTVPASSCSIPSAAQAYSLNMTVVPHEALEYLTVWPTGQAQPNVSTLNSLNGSIVANAAIVPAGSSGAVSVFVTGDTDVIIDINGYFAAPGGAGALSLYTLTPCRVVDTRGATGTFGGPALPAGGTRSFTIPASSCSVPAAPAYSLNVTVVPPASLLYLTVWPQGQTQPVVSTLNSPNGAVLANAAIVPSGTGGGISIYVSDATDVILDINAYFAQ